VYSLPSRNAASHAQVRPSPPGRPSSWHRLSAASRHDRNGPVRRSHEFATQGVNRSHEVVEDDLITRPGCVGSQCAGDWNVQKSHSDERWRPCGRTVLPQPPACVQNLARANKCQSRRRSPLFQTDVTAHGFSRTRTRVLSVRSKAWHADAKIGEGLVDRLLTGIPHQCINVRKCPVGHPCSRCRSAEQRPLLSSQIPQTQLSQHGIERSKKAVGPTTPRCASITRCFERVIVVGRVLISISQHRGSPRLIVFGRVLAPISRRRIPRPSATKPSRQAVVVAPLQNNSVLVRTTPSLHRPPHEFSRSPTPGRTTPSTPFLCLFFSPSLPLLNHPLDSWETPHHVGPATHTTHHHPAPRGIAARTLPLPEGGGRGVAGWVPTATDHAAPRQVVRPPLDVLLCHYHSPH
jgi:hypothetical protein